MNPTDDLEQRLMALLQAPLRDALREAYALGVAAGKAEAGEPAIAAGDVPAYPLRVGPGGVVMMWDKALAHLGLKVGERMIAGLDKDENGAPRVTLISFAAWNKAAP